MLLIITGHIRKSFDNDDLFNLITFQISKILERILPKNFDLWDSVLSKHNTFKKMVTYVFFKLCRDQCF